MNEPNKIDSELQRLSDAMLENKRNREKIENIFLKKFITEATVSKEKMQEEFYRSIAECDSLDYQLSLQMQNISLKNKNQDSINEYLGSDIVKIAAENFLSKYGLNYPSSQHIVDVYNIEYTYDTLDFINANHQIYLKRIEEFKKDKFTYNRLLSAGNYFLHYNTTLSNHYNKKEIDVLDLNESKGLAA